MDRNSESGIQNTENIKKVYFVQFFRILFSLCLCVFVFNLFLAASISAEETKICLTMIVKNEGKIIERCLNSVKDIIDCYSICDTGSTDNTIKTIEQFMEKNKIPGKVYSQPWKNFGHNRTLSIQTAQQTIKELGFSLSKTYLLLIDADMMMKIKPEFSKEELTADSYLVSQVQFQLSYYNTRLVRAFLPWKSIGVTHEYLSPQVLATEAKLDTLSIDDRDDGGAKADKFERDIKLLTDGLKEEPFNGRYHFYLAQSYKSLEKFEDAIKWYQKRIDIGGWKDEIWYSKFMIGESYDQLGQWDKALTTYLDAFQYNPKRAEPLQQISRHYRFKEQYNLAYLFAKQGSRIPYPKDDILFISAPVYDYQFDEEISIAAFYTLHKEEGKEATNRLMLKKELPGHVKDQSYKNMLSYINSIPGKFIPIDIDLPLIRTGSSIRYNPMNPSIRKTNEGYEIICRTVNYTQIGAKHFKSLDVLDPSNTINTRNFLLQYDKDLKKLSQQEIIEDLKRSKFQRSVVHGLEDCRLFEMNGSTWFTCTTTDTNITGQYQISLCKLPDDRSEPIVKVESLTPLIGPDLNKCEKNWLPFVKNGEFQLIYSYDPFIICIPKGSGSRFITLAEPKQDLKRFSGSAAPIEFDGGYLMLVHEHIDDGQRNYMHRFILLDKDFNIKQISLPFIFMHKGIEYCCSMTIDHEGKNLIIGLGIEDREAYLFITDLDTVRNLLMTG